MQKVGTWKLLQFSSNNATCPWAASFKLSIPHVYLPSADVIPLLSPIAVPSLSRRKERSKVNHAATIHISSEVARTLDATGNTFEHRSSDLILAFSGGSRPIQRQRTSMAQESWICKLTCSWLVLHCVAEEAWYSFFVMVIQRDPRPANAKEEVSRSSPRCGSFT